MSKNRETPKFTGTVSTTVQTVVRQPRPCFFCGSVGTRVHVKGDGVTTTTKDVCSVCNGVDMDWGFPPPEPEKVEMSEHGHPVKQKCITCHRKWCGCWFWDTSCRCRFSDTFK